YRLTGIPAGQYSVNAFAPALIAGDNRFGSQGKSINLNDGETVEGVDLALRTGGAITGRVTDADGQPLVQENVQLYVAVEQDRSPAVGQQDRKFPMYLPYNYMMSITDDRGVYRLFGVPPGRYVIAVGIDNNAQNVRIGLGNNYYP